MAKFTVDTHLFKELGELLVGRDSTALIELIKNAYDADATRVTVHGECLDEGYHGRISIVDNGVGMNPDAFHTGFLRIASRIKDGGDRRSRLLQRRYTGAKGLGRLAAHKLARRLDLRSVFHVSDNSNRTIEAWVDWDRIEAHETLDEVDNSPAIGIREFQSTEEDEVGTTLVLSRLRRSWNSRELANFLEEVQAFESPNLLVSVLPESIVKEPSLFDRPKVRDICQYLPDTYSEFNVLLTGDFASGDEYWEVLSNDFEWLLEVRSAISSDTVKYAICPTTKLLRSNPDAVKYETSIPHHDSSPVPHFDARIFVRDGSIHRRMDHRVWVSRSSGIRVFMEGFRIPPYGGQNDDWLSIDADYTLMRRQLDLMKNLEDPIEFDCDNDEGLMRLPHNNYVGGVFLTHGGCPDLKVLVNREGFVPNSSFAELVRLVRVGIDLCTRVRARTAYEKRQERVLGRRSSREGPDASLEAVGSTSGLRFGGRVSILTDLLTRAVNELESAELSLASGKVDRVRKCTYQSRRLLHQVKSELLELATERSLVWVLASVGTQMAAFVHEINVLLGNAQAIEAFVAQLSDKFDHSLDMDSHLKTIARSVSSLRLGLERQASYLLDVTTPDSRRRRVPQPLSMRLEAATRLVQPEAERRRTGIENCIPSALKSPPMFQAEIVAVFSNLLTNAIKAAGTEGKIRVSAVRADGCVTMLMENTGTRVDVSGSERWFKPFESTTSEVDPVLGQGMGLGLTITRRVLESYGATISFVVARPPYASALQITFP